MTRKPVAELSCGQAAVDRLLSRVRSAEQRGTRGLVGATLTCSLLLVEPAVAQIRFAWWVTAAFEATDTSIESIPVRELDESWIAASPLREAALPPEAAAPGHSLEDHDAAFEREGDFNRDGRPDKAIVGVYRASGGDTGGFLLIVTRNAKGQWSQQALFTNGGGQFSALTTGRNGRLVWAFCFQCDETCSVIPTRDGYRLNCFGP